MRVCAVAQHPDGSEGSRSIPRSMRYCAGISYFLFINVILKERSD